MAIAPTKPLYTAVLLKLSGESLSAKDGLGIDSAETFQLAQQISSNYRSDLRLGIVIGGGNIWRGFRGEGRQFERSASDHIGMLATLMNAIALKEALRDCGVGAEVLNHLGSHPLSERFNQQRALNLLECNKIVIFAGGTGHPYFTTDTAAAVMALQIKAQVLLKATQVDGIYSSDPNRDPQAMRLKTIDFDQVFSKRLEVMDRAAFTLCQENRLPIRIFSNKELNWFQRALCDESFGSLIHP